MTRPDTDVQQPRPSCFGQTRQPVAMAKKSKPAALPTDADASLPEDHVHPQFVPGQKVRDVFGKVHVVAEQVGCAVYLRGQAGWCHPAKLFPA